MTPPFSAQNQHLPGFSGLAPVSSGCSVLQCPVFRSHVVFVLGPASSVFHAPASCHPSPLYPTWYTRLLGVPCVVCPGPLCPCAPGCPLSPAGYAGGEKWPSLTLLPLTLSHGPSLQALGSDGVRVTMESALTARDRVGVQDFVLLENFTSEAAFIENLRRRFRENLIYVRPEWEDAGGAGGTDAGCEGKRLRGLWEKLLTLLP